MMDAAIVRVTSADMVLPRNSRAGHGVPSAFTLIELLVVIAIISILMAVLVPTLSAVRERGRQTRCMANLRSIGQAIVIYADDNQNRLPPGDCAVPWMVWSRPDESLRSDDTSSREVNLGHVLKAGILPMPTDYDTVLLCPSSRAAYPSATPEALSQRWGIQSSACITYMYNETLDGFVGEPQSGKGAALAHKKAINFARADGSVDTLRIGHLVWDEPYGSESLAEVMVRYGVCFPTSAVFRWLEQGTIDLVEARAYLEDPPTWCRTCAESTPRRLVLLAEVGSKPLVADVVGSPKYG